MAHGGTGHGKTQLLQLLIHHDLQESRQDNRSIVVIDSQGDLIRTIRDNREYIAHFHTGGVPGRNELDDRQEVNWRAVCRAIVDTGFTGYVAHEFKPTGDPLASLRDAVALCDV